MKQMDRRRCLLLALRDFVGLLSLLGLLGADAPELAVRAGLGDGVVSLEVLEVFGQLHGARSLAVSLQGHQLAAQLGSLLDVLLGSVALPRLLGLEGEEDQLGLVLLEALSVELKRLQGLVAATVVDGNADGASLEIKKAKINPEREVRPMSAKR